MNYLKETPTHIWLLFVCLVLLVAYYIRPDPITVQLLNGFFSALLLSLNPNKQGTTPPTPPKVP